MVYLKIFVDIVCLVHVNCIQELEATTTQLTQFHTLQKCAQYAIMHCKFARKCLTLPKKLMRLFEGAIPKFEGMQQENKHTQHIQPEIVLTGVLIVAFSAVKISVTGCLLSTETSELLHDMTEAEKV